MDKNTSKNKSEKEEIEEWELTEEPEENDSSFKSDSQLDPSEDGKKEETIELVSKKKPPSEDGEKPEKTHIKMYKFQECPYCGNQRLWYDKERKIYYCPNCKRGFQ